ncbi:DUF4754 family protein [Escherichia coli]|uniref:DUF4754 family protein n=1 Tax=uncultured Escherichia sp. TaxID=237777 RepID=UPI0018574941|nr:DUF4754 family protein [uncultured Escherichia sp.]EFA4159076.1 DUF4754 domain-containing protein [Escherichia coli O174:H7]EFB1289783.1 DUF4754 domain-containing protein [Escherichia coli]EFB1299423.1 DUF4754 domain-containing protein [Escherichia coli]EFH9418761.1 DUF4754 domain-containing protein [Escherichia coli]EKS5517260.1 DUF4754 family protein [Escherichia coli]
MDKEYKTLINKALEQYHFDVEANGETAAPLALNSLTESVCHLLGYTKISRDFDAYREIGEIVEILKAGSIIEPYTLESAA